VQLAIVWGPGFSPFASRGRVLVVENWRREGSEEMGGRLETPCVEVAGKQEAPRRARLPARACRSTMSERLLSK
jgi:hypothetical protein